MGIFSSSRYVIQRTEKPEENDFVDTKDDLEEIEDYEQGHGIHIINKSDTLDELEDEHDDWQSMTKYQRMRSDEKSIEMFGKTNKERYEDNKAELLKLENNMNEFFNMESKTINENEEVKEDVEDNKVTRAKKYTNDSSITVIYPTDDLDELNKLWDDWNGMTYKEKLKSDNKCTELFGLDNKSLYDDLKGKALANKNNLDTVDKDMQDKVSTSSNIINTNESVLINRYLESFKETDNTVYEDLLINQDRELILNKLYNDKNYAIDFISDLPFFTKDTMDFLGVFNLDGSLNRYGAIADNSKFNKDMSTKQWHETYNATLSNGIVFKDSVNIIKDWIKKLNELYSDFDSIKESGIQYKINARKQSILELGWNPEIDFNAKVRAMATDKYRKIIKENYPKRFKDYSNLNLDLIEESNYEKDDKFPIFAVLSYTHTLFGKGIKAFTHSIYSYASFSLDSNLEKMYSYTINTRGGGFVVENIKNFKSDKTENLIAVYCILVNKAQLRKIKLFLDQNLLYKNKYAISGIIGIILNKPVYHDNEKICSQFVADVFKNADIDITGGKNTSLVTPNDIYNNASTSFIKVYEGPVNKFNYKDVDKKIDKMKKSKPINSKNESLNKVYNDFIYINEVKDIPIEFDEEGNLFIKNFKMQDIESEYSKSHRLLKIYDKEDNIEGMKYELAKLWFMNEMLEKKIYKKKDFTKKDQDLRSKILNDFNTYLRKVQKIEKDFNFTEYYESTPFCDKKLRIKAGTIKYISDIAKDILIFLNL